MKVRLLQPGQRVRVVQSFVDVDKQLVAAGEEVVFVSCSRSSSSSAGEHTLTFADRVLRLSDQIHDDILDDGRDAWWQLVPTTTGAALRAAIDALTRALVDKKKEAADAIRVRKLREASGTAEEQQQAAAHVEELKRGLVELRDRIGVLKAELRPLESRYPRR